MGITSATHSQHGLDCSCWEPRNQIQNTMLQVDFKHPIGHYTHKFGQHKSKNLICPANALCAMVHKYDHPAHGAMIDLCGFFGDIQHAKKCIENGYFSHCTGITFYAKGLGKEHWKLIQVMTENGIKVTIK